MGLLEQAEGRMLTLKQAAALIANHGIMDKEEVAEGLTYSREGKFNPGLTKYSATKVLEWLGY